MQFATLSAALASAEDSPISIFKDLQFRAHRLKGAAAIFEFRELSACAHDLEKASSEAVHANAQNNSAAVWSALVKLVGVLGEIRGEGSQLPSNDASQQRRRPTQ